MSKIRSYYIHVVNMHAGSVTVPADPGEIRFILLNYDMSQLPLIVGRKGNGCTTDVQLGGRKQSSKLLSPKLSKVSATPCVQQH